MRDYSLTYGTLAETGEKCVMRMTGYWIGSGGRHISSYERVDQQETDIHRQYSMDRKHRFYVETEDKILW